GGRGKGRTARGRRRAATRAGSGRRTGACPDGAGGTCGASLRSTPDHCKTGAGREQGKKPADSQPLGLAAPPAPPLQSEENGRGTAHKSGVGTGWSPVPRAPGRPGFREYAPPGAFGIKPRVERTRGTRGGDAAAERGGGWRPHNPGRREDGTGIR